VRRQLLKLSTEPSHDERTSAIKITRCALARGLNRVGAPFEFILIFYVYPVSQRPVLPGAGFRRPLRYFSTFSSKFCTAAYPVSVG